MEIEQSQQITSKYPLFWASALGLALLALVVDPPNVKTGERWIGHAERVAILARMTARRMGLSDRETDVIYLAGFLHDVGKVETPEGILNKPAPLTEEERESIKCHPAVGREIVDNAMDLHGIGELVFMHHERYDGKGYPCGVKGADIPLGARIIAVADAFEAMISHRPYRAALSFTDAVAELARSSGKQFDPKVVSVFVAVLDQERAGRFDLDVFDVSACPFEFHFASRPYTNSASDANAIDCDSPQSDLA